MDAQDEPTICIVANISVFNALLMLTSATLKQEHIRYISDRDFAPCNGRPTFDNPFLFFLHEE